MFELLGPNPTLQQNRRNSLYKNVHGPTDRKESHTVLHFAVTNYRVKSEIADRRKVHIKFQNTSWYLVRVRQIVPSIRLLFVAFTSRVSNSPGSCPRHSDKRAVILVFSFLSFLYSVLSELIPLTFFLCQLVFTLPWCTFDNETYTSKPSLFSAYPNMASFLSHYITSGCSL